ncbi:metallophosphoesterase [Paenibacillus typhae]|uniref:Predicted phosphohydrolase, MPP superfamily n=1 Tax=Paenibacillus typhae TaxID=1174501 RepID=A0A1G9C194_9BACL|nr:metallophosphoesterase [Paenibacillus typhae]SDK45452.1 Predicted phosphohydrolase, MPP superfamily [Paenibacillus typhae]
MVAAWIIGAAAALLLGLGIIGTIMVFSAFGRNIIAEEIFLAGLPPEFDGFRILFITDIHRRRLPEDLLAPLAGKVEAVFLGGDITEKGNPLTRLADNMKLVASLAPVYAVHGNHDYKAKTNLADNIIRASGARLLMNENVSIEHQGGKLLLTGVDFPRQGGKKGYAPLPAVPSREAGCFRIILVHDPLWLSGQDSVPADLILAGHTHGGQVVLPFSLQMHADPFYRTYNAGKFTVPRKDGSGAEAKLLISRGFGTAHLPVRWRSPAEIHVLTLRQGKDRGKT